MSIQHYSPIVLSMLMTASCATNHFDRNEKFSTAGTDYTESVSELLKKTQDRLIEVNTKLLLISPHPTAKGRREALEAQNVSLAALLDKIDVYRSHNDLLGRYFTELAVVSNTGRKTDVGITLGKLSHTIANLNKKAADEYGISPPPRMSYEQGLHAETIGDHLIKTHYAKKIQRLLRRDSKIIETQLYLQGKQLDMLISMMQSALKEGSILHHNQQVMEPYVKGDFADRTFASWPDDRKKWFEMRRTEHVFKQVKEAQKEMSWAWQDIVRGKRDISSVNNSLKDADDLINAMSAFNTNNPRSNNSRIPIQ